MKKIYCMLLIASVVSIVAPIRVVAQTDLTNTYVTITDKYEDYNIQGYAETVKGGNTGTINYGKELSYKWNKTNTYRIVESFAWEMNGTIVKMPERLALSSDWIFRYGSGNNDHGGIYNEKPTSTRPFVLLNLFQGDKVTILYDNGGADGITAMSNDEKLESNVPYTVKQDGDLELMGAGGIRILKIRIDFDIDSREVARYEVDEDKGTFRFTSGGVLKNRTIKEVPYMEMRFGNTELPNKTVISKFGDGDDCWGATVKDQYNNGWLWSANPNNYNGDYKGDYETGHYYQGTFYVFKPSLDGELVINGYNDKGGPCEFSHYYLQGFEKDLLKTQGKCTLTRKVKAGYMYIFHATPYPGGDLDKNIFHLTSFRFTPTVDFKKPYVVIKDGSTSYTFQQFPNGTGTTFYVRTEGDITQADLDEKNGVLKWSGNGGAIIVTAVHTDDANNEEVKSTAYCVITVPYAENKEWDFSTTETKKELNLNTTVIDSEGKEVVSNTDEWALDWKVYRHEVKDDDGPTGNNKGNADYYTELERPVFSNSVDVTGDNARFIDKTAGLLFFSPIKCFGTNITEIAPYYVVTEWDGEGKEKAREWGYNGDTRWMSVAEISEFLKQTHANYDLSDKYVDNDMMGESITMEVGSKMVIPNLKKGQHIRIRWDRHFWNNGELMMAENVTDLEGTSMDKKLFYVGAGSVNVVYGHHEFIVENDGDVAFTLVENGEITIKNKDGNLQPINITGQQGWVNIKNIKIGPLPEKNPDFYFDTHMTPTIAETAINKPDKIYNDANVKEKDEVYSRDAAYIYIHKKTERLSTEFSLSKNDVHTQNGRQDDKYYVLKNSRTGTLTEDNCNVENDKNLTIKENAHGSFTLVLESRHVPQGNENDKGTPFYCYEPFLLDSCHVKVKVFEYDYNEKKYPYTWAMEHFTKDTGNNTLEEIDNDSKYWEEGETDGGLKHRIFKVGYPENMIAWMRRTNSLTYKLKEGETFTAGTTLNLGTISLTYGFAGGAAFTAKATASDSYVRGYTAYTEGNGENGTSTSGTVYIFKPQHDGKIEVAVVHNDNNKEFYILEDGTVLEGYNGITVSEKYYGTYTFDVKAGKTYKVFCTKSKLGFYGFNYILSTSKEEFVPEFDGLGFIPEEYWDHHDTNVQLEPAQNGIKFSKMGENPDKTKGYRLIVPNVRVNQTLYLATTEDTDKSSVSIKNGDSFTPLEKENYTGRVRVDTYRKGEGKDNGYDDPEGGYYHPTDLHIYKVNGKGGDIELLLKDLILHKVAVSVDTKTVSNSGYATEAREYPLDFTLARLFLGEEQKAYKVTGVTEDKQYVKISEVRYIPATKEDNVMGNPKVNNGVMITGDYLTDKAHRKATRWPLFTTDIDRATSDMNGNLLVGVVSQSNIEKNLDQKTDEYYNYMLAGKGYNVSYDIDHEITDGDTGKATSEYEGLGFYLALKIGTDMSAVRGPASYPGGKPKDHSAYLKLNEKLAKYNDFSDKDNGNENADIKQSNMYVNSEGVYQVFFIDSDSIVTGIDEVLVDDDDLSSTEENNHAGLLQNGVFYTLQGVPVKNPTKGIYIFNGKKVYVK